MLSGSYNRLGHRAATAREWHLTSQHRPPAFSSQRSSSWYSGYHATRRNVGTSRQLPVPMVLARKLCTTSTDTPKPPTSLTETKNGNTDEPKKPVEFDESVLSPAQGPVKDLPLPFYDEEYIAHLRNHFANLKPRETLKEDRGQTPHKQTLWIDTVEKDEADRFLASDEANAAYPWAYSNMPYNRHRVRHSEPGRRESYQQKVWESYSLSREATRKELWQCLELVNDLVELRESAPSFGGPKGKVVGVPEPALVRIFGSEFRNKAGVRLGSGCTIHVLGSKLTDKDGRRQVVLAGSQVAVKLAEKQISDAIKGERFTTRLGPFREAGDNPNSARSVWAKLHPGRRDVLYDPYRRRPVDVPRPREWTVKTLAEYVEDLVSCKLPESRLRQYYSGYAEFYKWIADTILDLLNDPQMQKLVSERVVTLVMTFFARHQNLSMLNRLIPLLSDFVTTRTFRALTMRAARQRDLGLFRTYINMMRDYKISPDGFEVVQLLRCIASNKIRSYMLLYLQQQGLLKEPAVKRAAVQSALQDSFLFHLTTSKSVSHYMSTLNDVFEGWLSRTVINNLVLESGYAKNPEALAGILHYCEQNLIQTDHRTLTNGLKYFADSGRFISGIKFFLHMRRVHKVARREETIQLLFELAWRRRAYNVCRLVWRHACLEGCVNAIMQRRVFMSILKNTPAEPTSNSEFWNLRVGKVVTSLETDLVTQSVFPNEPAYIHENCIDPALVGYTSRHEDRPDQYGLAKGIISKDLRASERYRALMSLEISIESAMELDVEWGKMQKPVEWIFSNAIRVPVTERRRYQQRKGGPHDPLHVESISEKELPPGIQAIFFDKPAPSSQGSNQSADATPDPAPESTPDSTIESTQSTPDSTPTPESTPNR